LLSVLRLFAPDKNALMLIDFSLIWFEMVSTIFFKPMKTCGNLLRLPAIIE
jgi:hypothetical protein